MSRKSVLSGKKFNGRHTTFLQDFEPVLKVLKASPLVTKIVIGELKPLKGVIKKDDRFVKGLEIPAGLRVTYRGFNGRQIFFVYTKERREVLKLAIEALRGD